LRGNGRETVRFYTDLEGVMVVSVPLRGNGRETELTTVL